MTILPLRRGVALLSTGVGLHPLFTQAVVLLCEAGRDGAFGIIVNKPLEEAIPLGREEIDGILNEAVGFRSGGPLDPHQVMLLHGWPDQGLGSLEILPGVWLGGGEHFLESAMLTPEGPPVLVCAGHCAWGPGELERELLEGDWLMHSLSAADLFGEEPWTLWQALVRRIGPPYDLLATMPDDLTLN